ncbi:HDOD domain-containing protein [Reinekea sp.]|jgi:HD-like signal output (HDOD) protein|uniref:HDOD domain-containing protein n=1 Tax=Reinekea sp. TaxID=1970455 RepID=UPI002A83BF06|nr:HDOD domain-containing protein [Reinekea sp.]
MSIEAVFSNGRDLPNLPAVVQELIAHLDSQPVNTDDIARSVQQDPVMAARVLALIHSSGLGVGRQFATLDSAIVLLDFDSIRPLIIASGIAASFGSDQIVNPQVFWRHSVAVALVAQELATGTPEADLAFLLGFIHHLGQLMLNLVHPQQADKNAMLALNGGDRHSLDRITLGSDQAEISAELARRWNFPDSMVRAIRQQSQPHSAERIDRYALILYLAIRIEDFFMNKTMDEPELVAGLSDICSILDLDLPAHLANLTGLIDHSRALAIALRQ